MLISGAFSHIICSESDLGNTVVSRVSDHSRVSAQVTVLPSRMVSAHSRVSAQVGRA